jgi:CheY-like chemotaxis protein
VKIWLVEDDGFKRDKVRQCLQELFPGSEIDEARSAKSAFNLLQETLPELIVLDMSLPTFDIGRGETGGRPQVFGGVEVMREMARRSIVVPVLIVTQYEVFGEERVGIKELESRLFKEHPATFAGLVYYETASEQWKANFRELALKVIRKDGQKL